ncbi:hypothetical protein KBI33_01025 [Candidatus Shapirobacteria bacterium]|nr:hypothetical protein [Candidatus Shapirobacteria bacterium]
MPDQDKLILSRQTAELLLQGIAFFKENPTAKKWKNLDKDLFIFLCRELCQLPLEEEENFDEYLARAEELLKRIIGEELTAPSLPQNLEELVEAWESFATQKDAQAPPSPRINLPTVEDWIKALKEKRVEEEIAPRVRKALQTTLPHLSQKDQASLGKQISQEIAKSPFFVLPQEEKEAVVQRAVEKSLGEKQIVLGEEQKQALAKAMVTPSLPRKEPKPKETITPPVFKKFQEQIEQVLRTSLETTGKIDEETLAELSPLISGAVASNLPLLSQGELEALSLADKSKIAEGTTTAALGTIGKALVAKGISLSPSQTATLLDQLTITAISNLESLAPVLPENRLPQEKTPETEGTATPILTFLLHPKETATLILNPQTRRSLEALDRDPSLPFSLVLEGEETSRGEQIKNIFLLRGINFQSINLAAPLEEETQALVLAAKGITSADISSAIKAAREENWPAEEIRRLEEIFSRQLKFERDFPGLTQRFFRFRKAKEIISGQKNDQRLPSRPYLKIKSQTSFDTARWKALKIINSFLEKIGLVEKETTVSGKIIQSSKIWYYLQKAFQPVASFWQKTNIGKTIADWLSRQTYHFWQDALGQIRGFSQAGVKKAVQEGTKKGVTKAITWLSTKLAATKLGAALGSIAPGIGNAIGAVAGFLVDLGISFFKKGGEFLEKLTGGQTEAEQKLKVALGPFSFLVSPLAIIVIGAAIIPLLLVFHDSANTQSLFFVSEDGGGGVLPPSSRLILPSLELAEIIKRAAKDICVPEALLLAISRTEAARAWGYSSEEVKLFSTPNWWETPGAPICRGLCYNTCNPGECSQWDPDCAWTNYGGISQEADVRGVMQFELNTFNGYRNELLGILGREPHRCLIPDSIYAAALKIKADSGTDNTQCDDWSDEIVRKVAKAYCGSCDSPNCPNYCDIVLYYYHDYQNSLDIITNPSSNPNGLIAEKIAVIMARCNHDPDGYGFINASTQNAAIGCLENSDLDSSVKQRLIAIIKDQVSRYGTLQCVGFIQAIEGSLFPSCGSSASDWAQEKCWQNNNYYFLNNNISLVQEGDIAVTAGSSPGSSGHIGFITKIYRDGSGNIQKLLFVSAWGGGQDGNGGNINAKIVPWDYFTSRGYLFIHRK